jgi:hypothetical protein
VQRQVVADTEALRALPEPVDGETAGQNAAVVVEVAARNDIDVKSDSHRANVVEAELQGGDNLTETLSRNISGEKVQVEHALQQVQVPEGTSVEARRLLDGWSEIMQSRLLAIQAGEGTPDQKALMAKGIDEEHRVVANNIVKYGEDPYMVGLVEKVHSKWTKEGKPGGASELKDRISATRKEFNKRKKRVEKRESGADAEKKAENAAVKVKTVVETWADRRMLVILS